VIFDIYFWAHWLALHGLALGAALSGRRPLVCPPSVAAAGQEYQTFEVIFIVLWRSELRILDY